MIVIFIGKEKLFLGRIEQGSVGLQGSRWGNVHCVEIKIGVIVAINSISTVKRRNNKHSIIVPRIFYVACSISDSLLGNWGVNSVLLSGDGGGQPGSSDSGEVKKRWICYEKKKSRPNIVGREIDFCYLCELRSCSTQTIFNPTIEAIKVVMKKIRANETGSWKNKMPRTTVPTAPIPVQTG